MVANQNDNEKRVQDMSNGLEHLHSRQEACHSRIDEATRLCERAGADVEGLAQKHTATAAQLNDINQLHHQLGSKVDQLRTPTVEGNAGRLDALTNEFQTLVDLVGPLDT